MSLKFVRDHDFGSLHGYRTKGIVSHYLETSDLNELLEAVSFAKKNGLSMVPCGDGSNILIKDRFEGVFLKWTKEGISILDPGQDLGPMANLIPNAAPGKVLLRVFSGTKKSDLVDHCVEKSLAGIEFWAWIPGLVGGGIAMNASAYDGDIRSVVRGVDIMTPDGVRTLGPRDLNWEYRKVAFPPYSVVTSVVLELSRQADVHNVRKLVDGYITDRKNKHPLDVPSCGSVFKNPDKGGKGAWQLIKEAGLSGYSIGGAMVSRLHSNFIVNTGNATSNDVIKLIAEIKRVVKGNSGIMLEEEIRIY